MGAGFGGLKAARELSSLPVQVCLVDQNNYHTFQPLLYQVATAGLSPEEIAHNIRGIFHSQRNYSFRLGKVTGVNWDAGVVLLDNGLTEKFDYLILAAGSETSDFGVEGVRQYSFPLKSIEDAVRLRSHILRQFELADADPAAFGQGVLNLVVVGGGPTGVEMAGALSELVNTVLRKDHPHVDLSHASIYLIEAADKLLTPFAKPLQEYADAELRQRGVKVLLNETVERVSAQAIQLKGGSQILTHTVIWSAGVKASSLGEQLGFQLTKGGRVIVNPDLSVPGHPQVYVIGDMAASKDRIGNLYPQLAQVAIQSAQHAARQIDHKLHNQEGQSFIYHDPGSMATIGRNAAVAQFPNGWHFSGFVAWLLWLFLHLMYLVGFRNRIAVFMDWLWNYMTYDRSPRLVMNDACPKNTSVSGPG